MNWTGLFSKGNDKTTGPPRVQPPTPLQQQRLKQIGSLRLFHQRVMEVKRDSQYKVDFQVAGDDASLIVFLPDDFPNEKPAVMVSPRMQHVWVDDNMNVVGCIALNNFYMHSDLGKVLQLIIKEFQEHPPYIFQKQSPAVPKRPETSSYSVASSTFYAPSSQNVANGPLISVEPEPAPIPKPVRPTSNGTISKSSTDTNEILDQLSGLSISQLQELNDDPEALLNKIKEMSFIKDLQSQRDQLSKENEEYAKLNVSMKPELESRQDELRKAYDKHKSLRQEYDDLVQKQSENIEVFNLNNIITNLTIGAMQAEEASEEIAEEFLSGQLPVDDFLRQFLEKRKLRHLRKAKEEKARGTLQG